MEGCEDDGGHEHEDMPEFEQPLMEAMFSLTRDCMKSDDKPEDMVEYIEQVYSRYKAPHPFVECV